MDCKEAARLLYAYLDQELNERAVSQIREHLENCGPCFGNYQFSAALKKLIRKIEARLAFPPDLLFKIQNSLKETA